MWESIHDLVLDFHKQQPNMEEDEADLLWKNLMNIIDDMRNMNEDVANDDYFEDLSYNFDSNDVECEKVLLDIDRLIEEKITSDKTTENKHHKLRFWKMLLAFEKMKNNVDQLDGSKILTISLFALHHFLEFELFIF